MTRAGLLLRLDLVKVLAGLDPGNRQELLDFQARTLGHPSPVVRLAALVVRAQLGEDLGRVELPELPVGRVELARVVELALEDLGRLGQ